MYLYHLPLYQHGLRPGRSDEKIHRKNQGNPSLSYGMGVPYYRLAKLQEMLGVPIAVSTQSELMASMIGPVHAMFNYLMVYAAQSDCIYQDDTGVKIQSLLKETQQPPAKSWWVSITD